MAKTVDGGAAVEVESFEITEDEADRRMRGQGWDALAVTEKDPNFHYRWVNKSKLNFERKTKYLGYEPVPASSPEQSVLKGDGNEPMKKGSDAAGVVEVADLVLCRIPKKTHEAYRRANAKQIEHRTRAVGPAVQNAINSAGGGNLSYKEDRENPNMREG